MANKITVFINDKQSTNFKVLMEPIINNNLSDFDFFDKKKSHLQTYQPYQFLYRLNYAFDCFILAMHYSLY